MTASLKNIPTRMSAADYRALLPTLPSTSPTSKATRRTHPSPEEALQRACFEWVTLSEPMHPILKWLTHIPNGGKRSKGEGGKLKAMGVRKGLVDFMLPRKHRGWQGLAIELKSADGRLTTEQRDWLEALASDGYLTAECRTLEEFQATVKRFLNGIPAAGQGGR